jgi:hypothetical protein
MTRGIVPGHHLLLHLKNPRIRHPREGPEQRKQTLAGLSNWKYSGRRVGRPTAGLTVSSTVSG